MKYKTKNDACHEWVNTFNAIETQMIQKLMNYEPDEWTNITPIALNTKVYCFNDDTYGMVVGKNKDKNDNIIYKVELNNGKTKKYQEDDIECENYNLPMWGTMWSFGDNIDNYWLEECDGLEKMAECGFTIFENEEFGYFFGIDGAGYDFYEAHWIPLYDARELCWHDKEIENKENEIEEYEI